MSDSFFGAPPQHVYDWALRHETPEERAYRIYAPDSAFEVTVTNGTTFKFSEITKLSARASFTVDWGDGATSVGTATYSALSHTYAATGTFVIRISDDVYCFCVDGWNDGIRSRAFVTAALRWGDSIEYTGTFGGFAYCVNMRGFVPRWPPNTTYASSTYSNCKSLTCTIPPWTDKITNAQGTYSGSGVTGAIPPWGPAVAIAQNTYYACAGLTGTIPPWTDTITTALGCYWGCRGLTGTIPPWTDKITNAQDAYNGCAGLTGTIPPWTDKIINASFCYAGCTGLAGDIPAWGAATTSASYCYYRCSGLTGAWTDDPDELMPARITSHGWCVMGCPAALCGLFYSDWGGTRTK